MTSPLPRDAVAELIDIPATVLGEQVHRDEHILLWQVRGTTDFRVRDRCATSWDELTVRAAHALWIPAGAAHTVHVHANSTMLPTFFPVTTTATTMRGHRLVPVDNVRQSLILAHIQQATTAIRPPVNIGRQLLLLMEDAPEILDGLPTPTSAPARRVAHVIRFNPGVDRSAAELAAFAHASLRMVQRQFTTETGLPLTQWRTRARMAAGADLLRSGSSLDDVANRVGYADVSTFCRAFKSHYGVPTSEYLKRYTTA